jgi:ATP-dependent helicase Lhr and Lhr-like helicase
MASDATSRFDQLATPPSCDTALAALSLPLAFWFASRFDQPTTGQRFAWPVIAAGKNLLLCAPTGSGKTLAAFLPVLSWLLGESTSDSVKVLYVAPLKALIADARKNLRVVLQELRTVHPEMRSPRVGRWTGDTPERVRRLLRRRPADILLTTPESLAVLLSRPDAAGQFGELRWIVVDEVHSLATCKRGADLALSLERLQTLSRFAVQRIGLSATCSPVQAAAGFLVGSERPCVIARVNETSPLDLVIEPLEPFGSGFLRTLLDRLEREIARHRTTLVFTNTRNLAERVTWALRRRWPERVEAIAVHHSSLSAARRKRVERRLKRGELRVVISSTSLELGIDIGSVDGVVLVHPPGGAVKLLQRVGRSGHAPGSCRRGVIFTGSDAELLEATVTASSGRAAQYEPLHVIDQPLDVLCQQMLGMAAHRPHCPEEAFAIVRRAYSYRKLSRSDFDACLEYLSGRTQDGKDWLPSRLRWDGDEFSIVDERTARLLKRNLGTILADEARLVRISDDRERITESSDEFPPAGFVSTVGQVDEPFADRLKPGDRFVLDGRCLEFRRAEGRSLIVEEASGYSAPPRWQGSGWPLATELAQRIYVLRVWAAECLREGPDELARLLRDEYRLAEPAARSLIEFFQRQEFVSEIPDTGTCLVEVVAGGGSTDHYIHTPLNRAGNDALARIAVLRLTRDRGRSAASIVADLGFLLTVSGSELSAGELRSLLSVSAFDADLEEAIRASWSFRERFHAAALIGFMLLRNPLGGRRRVGGHDWAERRLFDQVLADNPDFVLLRQARAEMNQLLDADAARAYLATLPQQTIRCRRLGCVSPLAESWTQSAAGPVESVESPAESLQRLHASLMGNGLS